MGLRLSTSKAETYLSIIAFLAVLSLSVRVGMVKFSGCCGMDATLVEKQLQFFWLMHFVSPHSCVAAGVEYKCRLFLFGS